MSPPEPPTLHTGNDRPVARDVGARWRVGGIAVVLVSVLWMLIASGLGRGFDDPVFQASLAFLAGGWALVAIGVFKRRHRRR